MKIASNTLVLSIVTALLVPHVAFALEDDPNRGPAASTKPAPSLRVEPQALCTKLGDVTGPVSSETASRFKKLDENFGNRNDKVVDHASKVETRIAEQRAKADAKRQEHFSNIDSKATTTQKQAVTAFQTAIKDAVAKRRAAVDAANTAYKQAVLVTLKQRQTQLRTAAAAYQTSVTTAVNRAKASCTAGAKPAVVRETLQAGLKAARQRLETARKAAIKVGNQGTLKATRKAAIDKANADFKASVQQALTTLKVALKTPSPSPSISPDASSSE
jgi:hypothetical protein